MVLELMLKKYVKRIYYNLQEITYIKKLEQNLTNKLREQGQIARYTFKDIKTKNKNMVKCIEFATVFSITHHCTNIIKVNR